MLMILPATTIADLVRQLSAKLRLRSTPTRIGMVTSGESHSPPARSPIRIIDIVHWLLLTQYEGYTNYYKQQIRGDIRYAAVQCVIGKTAQSRYRPATQDLSSRAKPSSSSASSTSTSMSAPKATSHQNTPIYSALVFPLPVLLTYAHKI